jgi:putative FmdB family regulatory protein
MPIYEFTCLDCRKPFEISRPMSEAGPGGASCPHCGSTRVERTWSSVFAITGKKS